MTSYKDDPNAPAVILLDRGSVEFSYIDNLGFVQEFKRHVRIKIFKKEAYDLANVANIQSDIGSFALSFLAKGNNVVAYRKFILNSKKQPKEKYNMLVDFLKNVAKADKSKLILVKT